MTTANKNLAQPAYNSGSWNLPLNSNFGAIDQAFGGVQVIDITGVSGNIGLVSTYVGNYPANSASYIPASLSISGVPSGQVNIVLPAGISGRWIIKCASFGPTYYVYFWANNAIGAKYVLLWPGMNDVYSDGVSVFSLSSSAGDIKTTGSSILPAGWLWCNGAALSTLTYPYLFSAIGYNFGGFGTTFYAPDLRGRALVGRDNNGGSAAGVFPALGLGVTAGTVNHTPALSDLYPHTHADAGHLHYDSGHTHADAGHFHTDSGHAHSDAGHLHGGGFSPSGNNIAGLAGVYGVAANTAVSYANIQTSYANITKGYASIAVGNAAIGYGYANPATVGSGTPFSIAQPSMGLSAVIKY